MYDFQQSAEKYTLELSTQKLCNNSFKCFAYSLSFNVKYVVEFVDPLREETAFKVDQKKKNGGGRKLSLSVVFCNSLESYLTDGLCVFSSVNILGLCSFMQTSPYN